MKKEILLLCCLVVIFCIIGVVFGGGGGDRKCQRINQIEKNCGERFYVTGFMSPIVSIPERTVGYRLLLVEAMAFAVREVNRDILQPVNLSLGYTIYDSCAQRNTTSESLLDMLLDKKKNDGGVSCNQKAANISQQSPAACTCLAIGDSPQRFNLGTIGPISSKDSAFISSVLSFTDQPVLSYFSTSTELNDKKHYPNFYRTIPDESQNVRVYIDLMKKYGWSFVSIISTDDSYGRSGRHELLDAFKENNICVDNDIQLYQHTNYSDVIGRLKEPHSEHSSRSKVVVVYATSSNTAKIFKEAAAQKFYNNITWILTSSSRLKEKLSEINPNVLNGALAVLAYGGKYAKFEDFFCNPDSYIEYSDWLKQYLTYHNANETKTVGSNFHAGFYTAGYVRNAVYAYAVSLKEYFQENYPDNVSYESCTFSQPKYLDRHFKKVKFKGLFGENVSFTDNFESQFIILNAYSKNGSIVVDEVGHWNTKQRLNMNKNIRWLAGSPYAPLSKCSKTCEVGEYSPKEIQDTCCRKCVHCRQGFYKSIKGNSSCRKCPSGRSNKNRTGCHKFELRSWLHYKTEVVILFVVCISGIKACVVIIIQVVLNRNNQIIKSLHFKYTLFQLCTQLLLFVSVMGLVPPRGSKHICLLRNFVIGPIMVLVLAFPLVKSQELMTICELAVRVTKKDVIITKSKSVFLLSLIVSIDLVLSILLYYKDDVHVEIIYEENHYFPHCELSAYVLGRFIYLIVILTIAGVQAFRSRKLPARYNESMTIAYIVLITMVIMVASSSIGYFAVDSGTIRSEYIIGTGACLCNHAILIFMYCPKLAQIYNQKKNRRISRGINLTKIFNSLPTGHENSKAS